jgi:DNA-directed RNA polymerase subunit M/transcription elongation factor TFIIS
VQVVGCLSVSTCGAVALYYYRKKQRVEELGMRTLNRSTLFVECVSCRVSDVVCVVPCLVCN